MKYGTTFIICCLSYIIGIAQPQANDSLLTLLNKHPNQDTVRLNLLNDISYNYSDYDYERGLEMADMAITLGKKLGYNIKTATAYRNKGLNYAASGENDSLMLENFNAALQLYKQEKDTFNIARTLNRIGLGYYGMSEYKTAISFHQQAYGFFKQMNHINGMAASINSLGVNYYRTDKYPEALDCYLQSLHLYEKKGEELYVAQALLNIGNVYRKLEKFESALDYHQKALNIYIKLKDSAGIAVQLDHLGSVYNARENTSKALDFYQQALAINRRLGNTEKIPRSLVNVGIAQVDLNHYAEAFETLSEALPFFQKERESNVLAVLYLTFGDLYRKAPVAALKKIDAASSNKYARAAAYYRLAVEEAKTIGSIYSQAVAMEGLGSSFEADKKYYEALLAYKQLITLKDSLFNDQTKEKITRLEMQADFDKKEAIAKAVFNKQQALNLSEIQRQRIIKNGLIAGAALLLVSGITIFIFYKRRRDATQAQQEAEMKAEISNTEMKALRSQMNPHFIFNSLNSIADFIDKQNPKTASYYTVKFARLMRMILEHSEHKEICLADDLKALELYMQLESIRMNHKFTYEIEVDDDINREETMVPPLLLQPFVENSIWHGFARKEGEGKLRIHIKKEGDIINCMVEDNGAGRNGEATVEQENLQATKKSLGMKITRARIDMLNRVKKTKAGVEITDLAQGLRVEVKLPLELSY